MERRIAINDVTMACEVRGTGTPVALVHGFPLDRGLWRGVGRGLRGALVMAPDLRGCGASPLGTAPVSIVRYADDLALLLEALGLNSAVVCGLSMGGYVALDLVRRRPELVRGLVLMDTRAESDSEEGRRGRDELAETVRREGVAALVERLASRLLAPQTLTGVPRVVAELRRMILRQPLEGVIAALHSMRDRADSSSLLSHIAVPTLVMAGADDQLIPAATARALAEQIPGAQFTLVAGAGHLPPLEQSRATAEILSRFIERVT